MALPTSGNITLQMLITEFGGGTKLTDFYRGGALVPDTAANANIPTSGQISLTQFYGASKVVNLTASPSSVSSSGMRPSNQSVTVTLSKQASATGWISGGTGISVTGASPGTSFNFVSSSTAGAASLTRTGTYRFTATDGSGQTVDIPVSMEHIGSA